MALHVKFYTIRKLLVSSVKKFFFFPLREEESFIKIPTAAKTLVTTAPQTKISPDTYSKDKKREQDLRGGHDPSLLTLSKTKA